MKKVCSTCNEEKLLKDFRKDRTQKSGYQCRCKQCSRESIRSSYITKYGPRVRARNAVREKEQRVKLFEYRSTHPCVHCGEDDPVCLDFHHLDPSKKDFQISKFSTRSWESIVKEIEKCAVLCRNCHAKVHAGIIIVPCQ